MKYTFITEKNITGKIPKENTNWNFDMLLQYSLDANHIPIDLVKQYSIDEKELGDVIILILPKTQRFLPNNFIYLKSLNPKNKICVMQEGTRYQWQDKGIEDIGDCIRIFEMADCILTHTEMDQKYFLAFNKNVIKVPTVIKLDSIPAPIPVENKPNNLLINGNLTSEYNIPFQVNLAKTQPYNAAITTNSSSHIDDYKILGIKQLPYIPYPGWLPVMNQAKIIFNIVNFWGASSQSIMAAALGIPCLGNEESEVHLDLFPKLSVKSNEFMIAQKLYKKLNLDQSFYKGIQEYALNRVKSYDYRVKIPIFREKLEKVLKCP